MKKYIVTVNGNKYEVEVEEAKGDFKKQSTITTPSTSIPKVKDEAKPVAVKKSTAEGEKIECPMPGTVLKINVAEGENVKKGDTVFVLEAMKMENEIMAPKDGKIVEINAAKGVQVNTGDVLAVIE